MKTEIQTFEQLVNFIEQNDLTAQALNKLVSDSVGVWLPVGGKTKGEILRMLKNYWEQYKNTPIGERPPFAEDFSIENCLNYPQFGYMGTIDENGRYPKLC